MERVFNTAKVFASRMDADERTMAAATLVQRLAAKNDELADHALDTGSLAARLAQSMGLSYDDVVEASLIGTLHEVGAIVVPAAVRSHGYGCWFDLLWAVGWGRVHKE